MRVFGNSSAIGVSHSTCCQHHHAQQQVDARPSSMVSRAAQSHMRSAPIRVCFPAKPANTVARARRTACRRRRSRGGCGASCVRRLQQPGARGMRVTPAGGWLATSFPWVLDPFESRVLDLLDGFMPQCAANGTSHNYGAPGGCPLGRVPATGMCAPPLERGARGARGRAFSWTTAACGNRCAPAPICCPPFLAHLFWLLVRRFDRYILHVSACTCGSRGLIVARSAGKGLHTSAACSKS
jgi:hypothetical protein